MTRSPAPARGAVDGATTVDEVVARHPDAAPLLVDMGLDTCCGGGSPLREACEDAQVPLDEVLALIGRFA